MTMPAPSSVVTEGDAFAQLSPEHYALAPEHGRDGYERLMRELVAHGTPPERIAMLAKHKAHAGNRPSTIVLFPELDPLTLGKLVALYEHKVFVQSVVWGNNAFDQWGVELGKKMCEGVLPMVRDPVANPPSRSIAPLLEQVAAWRRE